MVSISPDKVGMSGNIYSIHEKVTFVNRFARQGIENIPIGFYTLSTKTNRDTCVYIAPSYACPSFFSRLARGIVLAKATGNTPAAPARASV